jgi:hypothetical protein
VTITEFDPNRRVVYQAEGSAGLIRHEFAVGQAEGATKLTKSFDMVNGKFPFNLFYPIVAKPFILPGALKGDLERIKAKLEGS